MTLAEHGFRLPSCMDNRPLKFEEWDAMRPQSVFVSATPSAWEGDALYHPETHKRWRAFLNLGLTDAFRVHHHDGMHYTFWDYQRGAWQKNDGIRIDHFLLSPAITDRMINCEIYKAPRGEEKASDHTPIILEII